MLQADHRNPQVTPPQKGSGKPVPIITHTHILLPEANQMLQGKAISIATSVCACPNINVVYYLWKFRWVSDRQSGIQASGFIWIGRFTWGNNVCCKTNQKSLEKKTQKSFWVFQNKQPSSVSGLTLWTPKVSNSFLSALPTSVFQHKFRGLSKFKFLGDSQGRKTCLSYSRRDFQVQFFLGLSITMISKLLLQLARRSMWVCGCQTWTLGFAVLPLILC